MLTYISPERKKKTKPAEKPWVLLMLVFVWLWPGIINRDLWNPQEPYLYSVLQHIFAGGSLIAPMSLGNVYIENSPLVLWPSVLFKNLFSPWWMSGYTAARLSTTFFMILGLAAAGGAGRELLGRYHGRSVVLLLIGSPGIMFFGHMLGIMPMLFAAIAFFWYGISISKRRVGRSGLLIGIACLLAFWSSNFSALLFFILIMTALPYHPHWRNRQYLLSIIIALVLIIPLLPLWPYALFQQNPQAFAQWLHHYSLGVFGGLGQFKWGFSLWNIIENFLWYALPVWLLALWTIAKKTLPEPVRYACRLWLSFAFIYLCFQENLDNNQLIWLLLPMTLIAASSLDTLRRGIAAFFNWFGVMTFGALALFIWLAFFAVNYHFPMFIRQFADYYNPQFQTDWDYFPMLVALAFSPIWLLAVTRKNIRGRQAVSNWAAGMTLTWTLIFTLFLPWLDGIKSYRTVVMSMQAALPNSLKQQLSTSEKCIQSPDEPILIAWNEYGSIPIVPESEQHSCDYILSYLPILIEKKGEIMWVGIRSNSERDRFALLKKPS